MDSDFDETDTSLVIHALQLIAHLVLIIFYINMFVICDNCSE